MGDGSQAVPHFVSRLEAPMAAKKNTVELKADANSAMFMADGKLVHLDEKNPSYEAKDDNLYGSLLELPFLKATGKQDS